jgi:AraC family transcriptional regulator of adaptative response/methylated-DNA-[protein]-cysteine methyltransferase
MTPKEYKDGGRGLSIRYEIRPTPFGHVLIASTSKGICQLLYVVNNEQSAIERLCASFPNADIHPGTDPMHERALHIFDHDWNDLSAIKLHLKGTDFQLNIWRALLTIPSGSLTTYKHIATQAGNPNACRAAGTAIGDNPVAFLIPCHRVIQSSGAFGNYHWGSERKIAMIGWEGAEDDSATT